MRRRSRRIGVIGAGPGGLCAAIRLSAAGYDDITVFDRADRVGGTWAHNTYPGCACDVPSHLYSFSFRRKTDWTRPYARQPEILAYLEDCAAHYGLAPHLRLGTGVRAARWDGRERVWELETDDGGTVTVDVLISALGMFNRLSWPQVPGLDTFAGTLFHSARWDQGHDLRGENVAVIGTAASAVQFLPEIAPVVGSLYVYQRSPNWIRPRQDDTPFTPEQIERFRTDPAAAEEERERIWRQIDAVITFSDPEVLRGAEEAGLANIAVVRDPEVRRRLTPTYPFGCKRPLSSNEWYPMFNRPNVELVTEPIREVRRHSVVTDDGRERPVDTIIVATGFDSTRYLSAIEVTGRGGRRLEDAWSDGARAYLGITTAGFPNLFMLYGPNTNNGSIIYMIECQVEYVLRQLERMDAEDLAWIDVRPEVESAYNERLQRDLDSVGVWGAGGCHNYYRGAAGTIVTQWPHRMDTYRAWTRRPDPEAFVTARA